MATSRDDIRLEGKLICEMQDKTNRYKGSVWMEIHIKGGWQTLVRETDGNDMPTKNPKTTPKIVVTTSLAPSLDFFGIPLQ